jgi:restriction system protein
MAEMERQRLHRLAQESGVEARNADLELRLADIDNTLTAILEVDDHVDLERLCRTAERPPFQFRHREPIPAPSPIEAPPTSVCVEPEAPRGVGAVFGGKKHAEAVAAAQAAFAQLRQQWQQAAAAVPMQQLTHLAEHRKGGDARQANLAADRARQAAASSARARSGASAVLQVTTWSSRVSSAGRL